MCCRSPLRIGLRFVLALFAFTPGLSLFAEDYSVAALKEGPVGLSPAVTEAIAPSGLRLSGKDGVVCDLWLAKAVPLKAGFTPNLRIQYPFQNGQLIGAIRFPEAGEPHDFRGQSIKPGLYTLRYGLQPDDGNHLGTSEIRDFLCACPPDADKDPKRIEKIKDVFKLSAKAAGTTHPTIFLLLAPPEKAVESSVVKVDKEHEYVILSINATGQADGAASAVPLNLVVVGESEH
jgi:hypothetical protein